MLNPEQFCGSLNRVLSNKIQCFAGLDAVTRHGCTPARPGGIPEKNIERVNPLLRNPTPKTLVRLDGLLAFWTPTMNYKTGLFKPLILQDFWGVGVNLLSGSLT